MKIIIILTLFLIHSESKSIEYTESHIKLASEFIEINEMQDMDVDEIADEVLEYFEFDVDREVYTELKKEYIESFKTEYMEEVLDLYMSYYSEEDLIKLIEFYKSDIGKKVLETSDMLSEDIALTAELWSQKIYSKMESMVDEEGK